MSDAMEVRAQEAERALTLLRSRVGALRDKTASKMNRAHAWTRDDWEDLCDGIVASLGAMAKDDQ